MCYQLTERYAVCGCLYHKHAVDPCAQYGQYGHSVQEKTVLVGYACGVHSTGRSSGSAATISSSLFFSASRPTGVGVMDEEEELEMGSVGGRGGVEGGHASEGDQMLLPPESLGLELGSGGGFASGLQTTTAAAAAAAASSNPSSLSRAHNRRIIVRHAAAVSSSLHPRRRSVNNMASRAVLLRHHHRCARMI